MTGIRTFESDAACPAARTPGLAACPVTPCAKCGSHEVDAAMAPPGHRERAAYLRCRRCGRERDDLELTEFF